MILFFSETNFILTHKKNIKNWLSQIIINENRKIGNLNIVFYNDEQLAEFNKKYLHHDTLTDIITFDYSEEKLLHGDICISIDRLEENSKKYNCSFGEELRRVITHGVLHLCGYKDKKKEDKLQMKQKEAEALNLFNSLYNY
jgi:rRNA maturation RNase YbeY